jgi:MFS family permease
MTRTERTYYLIFALYNFSWSFVAPTYALFLLSRNLDLFEINAVLATYLLTSFLFEVPTGAVADIFGRKVSFLLSCTVKMSAFMLYSFCNTFAQFLFAEFIDAVGTTLASGALDAWVVDGMRAEGALSGDRFFARAMILSRCLMIVSGLIAGYVATIDLALPWQVGAAGFALTTVVGALTMHEMRSVAAPVARQSVWNVMGSGLRIVRATPVLRLLCLLTVVASFAMMPVNQLWQPRMRDLSGGQVWIMGWIWALLNLAGIVGSAAVARLAGSFARHRLLALATCWRSLTLAVAATAATFFPALFGLVMQEFSVGASEPLILAWLNEHAGEEHRATVLSVRAMAFTFGGASGLLSLGLVARSAGIPAAWLISAVIFAVAALGYLTLGRLAGGEPREALVSVTLPPAQ